MKYLEKIKDLKLKSAILKAYSLYGYKLHFLPSSLTGRHHPPDERGIDGLNKHVEKLCWFLDGVADEFQYPDKIRDILFTAAYFHDLGKVKETKVSHELTYRKKGIERETRLVREVTGQDRHPIESAKMAREFLALARVDTETIQTICDLIERHMGHWLSYLPQPRTELEKIFALADFIVSREDFKIERKRGMWAKIKESLK